MMENSEPNISYYQGGGYKRMRIEQMFSKLSLDDPPAGKSEKGPKRGKFR